MIVYRGRHAAHVVPSFMRVCLCEAQQRSFTRKDYRGREYPPKESGTDKVLQSCTDALYRRFCSPGSSDGQAVGSSSVRLG